MELVTAKLSFFILVVFLSLGLVHSALHFCDNQIYCGGPIIEHVARTRIYNDSKSFVDLKLKHSPNQTLSDFNTLLNKTDRNPTKKQVKDFIDEYFEDAGELVSWTPPDFNPQPKFLDKIKNSTIREFARIIVSIWPTLARKVKDDVNNNPEQYSFIPLPNGFVVPGGRFKEIYYWDTYWVIEGLLLSEMVETARGILENFASLIRRLGFIPNGSRIYYKDRSHPPFFTLMVYKYIEKTNDIQWLRKHIGVMDIELLHWINSKSVTIKKSNETYLLGHYISGSNKPRPESYAEDIDTCSIFDATGQAKCYHELKTGAETGWDFSSRWLVDDIGRTDTSLAHTEASRLVPVDLNSLLCKSFGILSKMYLLYGKPKRAEFWASREKQWKIGIENVLYDKAHGVWYDYDVKLGRHRKNFYPSNISPLAMEILDPDVAKERGCVAAKYIKTLGVNVFPGGIPTSLQNGTGQQWDYPNAWPPLQDEVITALHSSKCGDAVSLAKDLATTWIDSMIIGYNKTKEMFEKYDVRQAGESGGGGEYRVQTGFGWTNGAVLKLIDKFVIRS